MQFRLQIAIYALNTSSSSSRLSNKISSFDLFSLRIDAVYTDVGHMLQSVACTQLMIILKRSCSSVMALT